MCWLSLVKWQCSGLAPPKENSFVIFHSPTSARSTQPAQHAQSFTLSMNIHARNPVIFPISLKAGWLGCHFFFFSVNETFEISRTATSSLSHILCLSIMPRRGRYTYLNPFDDVYISFFLCRIVLHATPHTNKPAKRKNWVRWLFACEFMPM